MSPSKVKALLLAFAALLAFPAAVAAADDDLGAARTGTAAFRDVVAAESAGYARPPEGPLHECISSLDDTGAMGFHYINGDLVGDAELDPARPEALVYEPSAGGGRRLVAVEYVVFAEAWDAANDAPPSLFGQEFHFTGAPNRYELPPFYALHAWIWKANPAGTFADFNPEVSCLPDTATAVDPTGLPSPSAAPLLGVFAAALGLVLSAGISRRSRPHPR